LTGTKRIVAFRIAHPEGPPVTDHPDARELTYCDTDTEPTAADAARFLMDLFDRAEGRLPHRTAVERFLEEYGGRFLVPTREGFAIDREVSQRFQLLTGRCVLWDAADRSWRYRYSWEKGFDDE
jgi:hypothetical protein